jgi:hypothetical protein
VCDVLIGYGPLAGWEEADVPIDRLLERRRIKPEDSERLKQAFNLALSGLRLVDRNDPVCEIVARKIIEIGLDGLRSPQEIAAQTVKQLGQ